MLVKRFENQVEKQPHKIALKSGNGFITYDRLNRLANRIARLIEKKCPQPGTDERIGLLFEHEEDMIAAILGTLKAGKVYVPLSTAYPGKRIAYMLDDSGASLLLTNSRHLEIVEKLAPKPGLQVIVLDRETVKITDDNPPRSIKSKELAYILYTSGSTGKPKGVMQTHENVMYYTRNWIQGFSIVPADRMTLFSSFCHDGSVQDMFSALLCGAALYPYDMKTREESVLLSQFLVRERITIWHSVPSLYSYFANTLTGEEQFKDLRFILLGGEPVREHEVVLLKKFFPYSTLANVYGQTESSVNSIRLISQEDNFERMLIGNPLDQTQVFVIDEQGNPVDPLEPGEILVVCNHVSPGYWQQEEATRAAFGEAEEFGKLYWTGDLGCLLPNGEIEFLGRKDFQVKIRGFRIELGEIESRLLEHKSISAAVVVAREDENHETYLCAYFVGTNTNSIPTASLLREFLAQTLPDYMIPTHFMQLQSLPLTPNGKIDRKALPPPVPQTEAGYLPPRNPLEEKLTSIWAEILGLKKEIIGIHHNFFSLGGHSLKAVTLIARIHRQFDVKLPLAQVFKTPSIHGMALAVQQAVKNEFSAINPIEKREYYALSSAQKRLYFVQQLDLNSTGYNMYFILPLDKDMEKNKLESKLKQLITRHEGLRTSFMMVGEEPFQVIHDQVDFKIEAGDNLSSFIRPFDLSQAPLIRSGLIRNPDHNYTWIVDIHHIVTDGTSQMILAGDFIRQYRGEALPSIPLQYKDFAHWQNRLNAAGAICTQEDYWLTLYSEEIPRLNLVTDYKRPAVFTFTGDRYSIALEKEAANRFRELSHRQGGTLYMNILAILNTLFYKYTGQTDIIIGSSTAGRSHVHLQAIIGMFVNMLAIRNHPKDHLSYLSFLEDVVANCIKAFENQEVQFEELVETLDPERDLSRNPLFDISMVVQNFQPTPQIDVQPQVNENISPVTFKNPTAKFDMTFYVYEAGEKITISIEYYTAIFKKATIQRLASHFINIIQAVNKTPSIKLKDIDILSKEEKRQILVGFNDTAADYPKNKSLHQIFAEQVDRTPDNIAIIGPSVSVGVIVGAINQSPLHQITYKELNQKSNQLAHYLQTKGVKPDTIVGIMMERSVDMIIGILGILKAGGAYLPIDPDYPPERINYMIADSNTKFLVTTPGLTEKIKKLLIVNCQLLIVNEEPPGCPGFNNPPKEANSINNYQLTIDNLQLECSNLAYIIYTSGTTGKPKGVLINHRSVVRLMKNDRFQFDFKETDIWTLFHSFCFDFSVWEMYGALLYGGQLLVIPKITARDTREFLEILKQKQVTVLNQTPSAFYHLLPLELKNPQKELNLRYVIFGGEALAPRQLKEWKQKYPRTKLINMYGITETTVHVTFKEIKPGEIEAEISNIGKPIPTLNIYLLDKYLKPLPIGAPGELCVSGAGLARGYLNHPDLTAEKFIQQPGKTLFEGTRGLAPLFYMSHLSHLSYIYRSGDLARWLADGNIEFLGRIDRQVKIRGFRIELAEIESRLLTHQEIKEAVVIDKDDQASEKYLCAYIVSNNPLKDLDRYLSQWLPNYMIPTYFVPMAAIPLTPTGKLDRKALPEPGPQNKEIYTPPRDDIEKKLTEIWSEVLGRNNPLSMNDHFFKMGGHSLKATHLVYKIEKELKTHMPLVEVFNRPILQQMADYIKIQLKKTDEIKEDYVFLLKQGKNRSHHLFFIHDGTGEIEVYIQFCQSLDSGYNCWGIKAHQFQDYAPKNLTIQEMAAQYIEKIKMIQPSPPYSLAGWSLGGIIAFEIASQLEQMDQKINFLALIDSPPPQPDSPQPVEKFTLEHELLWIKDYLPVDIYEKIQEATQPDQLWQLIVRNLEIKELAVKEIKTILAQLGGRGIPHYEHMNISETIRYLGILRSFARARALYIPGEKINTPLHYFKAAQTKPIFHQSWKSCTLKTTTVYEVQGDHYSMFKPPHAADFAKTFTQIIKKIK